MTFARPSYDDAYKVAVTQDTLGGYHFKYNAHGISREEHKDRNGEVSGSYSYLDPKNERQHINFTAGRGGYVVVEGSNLPVAPLPVTETAEVAAERIKHPSLLAGSPSDVYGAPTTPAVATSSYQVPVVPHVVPASEFSTAPQKGLSSLPARPVPILTELALPFA